MLILYVFVIHILYIKKNNYKHVKVLTRAKEFIFPSTIFERKIINVP